MLYRKCTAAPKKNADDLLVRGLSEIAGSGDSGIDHPS